MEWSSSSDADSKRKLIQIGFAALLARKQAVNKQYVYESRDDGGFVFEPILRNNEPVLEDEEYMRKKYYSQVVYEAARSGTLQTSIKESDPNKQATRRLWAGRKGTGWAGTGKGGYMQSLQPGVPETVGTGLGTPKKESDLLMQVYLEQQAQKMHMLKGKSQQATADLFKKIVDHSNKSSGVPDLSTSPYTPSLKDQNVPFSHYAAYLRPHLAGEVPPANAPESQQREWVKKAHLKLEAALRNNNYKTDDRLYSTLGFAQYDYAKKLAQMKPESFTPSEMRRLLANNLEIQPAGGDRPVMGKEGMLKGVGGLYHDWQTIDEFGDFEDVDHPGAEYGPRGGKGPAPPSGPSKYEGSDFTGDGGALTSNNMEIADAKLLRTTFKKTSIDELFPKAWQEYQSEKRVNLNQWEAQQGRLLNQTLDTPQVQVNSVGEAMNFVRWMQDSLNKEQEALNQLIPQYDDHGLRHWKSKGIWPSRLGIGDTMPENQIGNELLNYSKSGGIPAIERGGTQQFIKEGGGWMGEIASGFLRDFGLFNDEARYLMSNRFGMVSGSWDYINRDTETRGVDLYLPQTGGLLKIHISAKIVPATAKTRPYVKLDIPYPSKWNNYTGGVTFLPDVTMSYAESELAEMKGTEGLAAYNQVSDEFWRRGTAQQYLGMTMLTQNGQATRMFMGDASPVNSVGFFTSTISVADFAQQLKSLVDISAKEWWGDPTGFGGYFNLEDMQGGAFREWAVRWEEESRKMEDDINHRIEMKWKMWVENYAGGGVTAAPPSIAKSWAAPIKLGPFVHSTKYLGQAQSAGRRPHGYYVMGDWEGGPMTG